MLPESAERFACKQLTSKSVRSVSKLTNRRQLTQGCRLIKEALGTLGVPWGAHEAHVSPRILIRTSPGCPRPDQTLDAAACQRPEKTQKTTECNIEDRSAPKLNGSQAIRSNQEEANAASAIRASRTLHPISLSALIENSKPRCGPLLEPCWRWRAQPAKPSPQ